jgi:hypothetical protein
MSVINGVKQLLGNSRLFVEADQLDKRGKGKIPIRGKRARQIVKIGQGGTLDPLADGALGRVISFLSSSRRRRKGHKTSRRILGLRQGTSSSHQ